jgi:hypothetical protein
MTAGSAVQINFTPGATPSPRTKGRGLVARGFLALFGFLAVIVLVVGALLFRVPQRLGIWSSGAGLLDGTPDRASAAAMVAQLAASGFDTTGLTLVVMPVKGQDGTLAYAVLDVSAGFHFPSGAAASPLLDLFGKLARGSTVDKAGIRQVAIEYRDAGGHRLGVLTASVAAIRQFVAGQLDQQAFSAQLHGDVDPAAFQAGTTP